MQMDFWYLLALREFAEEDLNAEASELRKDAEAILLVRTTEPTDEDDDQ
jgi:hypothetical protein